MKQENMPRADFVTAIVFIAFGIGVLALSLDMPTFQDRGVNPYSAPGIVPGFLGVIIGGLGLVLLIRSILQKGYRLNLNTTTVRGFLTNESTKRLAITILVSVAYGLVLVGRVPYWLATGVYVFVFILLFDLERGVKLAAQWKSIASALAIAVITSTVVTSVFRYVFLVNLPG